MLVRRVNRFNQKPLLINDIIADPHGQLLCLFTRNNLILLIEMLSFYRYFQLCRLMQKDNNYQYSFKQELPVELELKPTLNLPIFKIHLSRLRGKVQTVVIVYAKSVEIVDINNEAQCSRKVLSRMRSQIFEISNEIIYSNLLEHKVYLTSYTFNVIEIDLENYNLSEKYREKSSISTPIKAPLNRELVSFQGEGTNKLWQNTQGTLLLGDLKIAHQFVERLNISNSYEEYKFREEKQFSPIKYELSLCGEYLLGSDNLSNVNEQQPVVVRLRDLQWQKVCQLSFKPIINNYFTHYVKYHSESSKAVVKSKEEKILFSCLRNTNQIMVGFLIIALLPNKKVVVDEIQTQSCYSFKLQTLLTLQELKHPVLQVLWVGLTQLILVCQLGQTYYCQFPLSILKIK